MFIAYVSFSLIERIRRSLTGEGLRLDKKEKGVEPEKPRDPPPGVVGAVEEGGHSIHDRGTSPFEVAYTFFFVGGIISVFFSLLVPVISTVWGFSERNDLLVYLVVIVIMVMVIFQLSRIYFVLHKISDVSRTRGSFLAFPERPWSDFDKLLQFTLAAIIIASPKFDFLYPFLDRPSLNVVRQGNFPIAYNVEAINAVLWNGAGYCLALAACFFMLICWDLNVFSHNIRRIANSSSTELEIKAFREFFYLEDRKLCRNNVIYFTSQKFLERATGLGFSMSMVLFIGDWSYAWVFLSLVCLVIFWTIVTTHRRVALNKAGYIFTKLVMDVLDIIGIRFGSRPIPNSQHERTEE